MEMAGRKEGNHHCWLPNDFRKMMSYLNNEKAVEGIMKKIIQERKLMKESLEQILQMA